MQNFDDLPKASSNQTKAMNEAHDKWMATQQPQAPVQQEFQQQEYQPRQYDTYHATMEDMAPQYQQKNMPDTEHYQAPQQQFTQPDPVEDDQDTPVTAETKREFNTRMMREKNERLEQENHELRRREQQIYMQQQQYQQPQRQVEVEDDYADVGDDELMEGSKVKQILRKQEEKIFRKFEQTIDQRMANLQQETSSLKITNTFPDFNNVVTEANVAMLEKLDPELADMISREPDMFKVKKTIYNQIKRMGIYKEDTYSQQRTQAQSNAMKPKPSAAVSPQQGSTPMQQANAFANGKPSAEYHKEMMAQMYAARKSS